MLLGRGRGELQIKLPAEQWALHSDGLGATSPISMSA